MGFDNRPDYGRCHRPIRKSLGAIQTLGRVGNTCAHVSGLQNFLPNPSDVSALYLGGWLLVLYVGYTMLSISHNS